jgi:BlaI family penicillinase repressor
VDHIAYGKTYEYFPIVSKDKYRGFASGKLVDNYFGGSLKQMVSFFMSEEKIDLKEADEIMKLIGKMKE